MTVKYSRFCGELSKRDEMLQLEIECDSGKGNKEHFESLLEKNPFGSSIIVIASNEEGKIIGKNQTIPTLIGYNGNTYSAHLSCGTLVHTYARGKGVFRGMIEFIYRELEKESAAILCGFPNKNSAHGFQKYFSWEPKAEILVMKKIIRNYSNPAKMVLSFFSILLNRKRDKRYTLTKYSLFHKDLDICLKSNIANKREAFFFKNIDNLNWRYAKNKEVKYDLFTINFNNQPFGFLIVREVGVVIKIVDFQIVNQDKKGLAELPKLIEKQYPNAKRLDVYSGPARWYHNQLKRSLFFVSSKKKNRIKFFLGKVEGWEFPEGLWDIHMGDTDVE